MTRAVEGAVLLVGNAVHHSELSMGLQSQHQHIPAKV